MHWTALPLSLPLPFPFPFPFAHSATAAAATAASAPVVVVVVAPPLSPRRDLKFEVAGGVDWMLAESESGAPPARRCRENDVQNRNRNRTRNRSRSKSGARSKRSTQEQQKKKNTRPTATPAKNLRETATRDSISLVAQSPRRETEVEVRANDDAKARAARSGAHLGMSAAPGTRLHISLLCVPYDLSPSSLPFPATHLTLPCAPSHTTIADLCSYVERCSVFRPYLNALAKQHKRKPLRLGVCPAQQQPAAAWDDWYRAGMSGRIGPEEDKCLSDLNLGDDLASVWCVVEIGEKRVGPTSMISDLKTAFRKTDFRFGGLVRFGSAGKIGVE
ncbi:hypothetical protein DFJ77DRAFT_480499 [Powellomyces hirtus]|nr:hypothetical protein DFJ77DRAFT_480499 [Powellomyces hirtus]